MALFALFGAQIDAAGELIDGSRMDRILRCQTAVRAKLDDPYSAKLPDPSTESKAFVISETGSEIAEVFQFRAKNRMGAYQKMTARCSFGGVRLIDVLVM